MFTPNLSLAYQLSSESDLGCHFDPPTSPVPTTATGIHQGLPSSLSFGTELIHIDPFPIIHPTPAAHLVLERVAGLPTMVNGQGHPQAAGPADPSVLENILDAAHNQVRRAVEVTRRNLGDKINAQTLGRAFASAAGSVYSWTNLVVDAMRQPIGYKLEVQRRPVWMHVAFVLVLALAAQLAAHRLIPHKPAASSCPPVTTTVAHDLQEEATTDPGFRQYEVPGLHPPEAPYKPDESGVVSEICYLVSQASAQTGHTPWGETLYKFVKKHGATRSDSPDSQKLCKACLTYQDRLSSVGQWGDIPSFEQEEAEAQLWILARTILLLEDPSTAAIYQRLFVDGTGAEDYKERESRMVSLCGQLWPPA